MRKSRRNLGSPVVALFDNNRDPNPGKHIGYYDRRSHQLFTVSMNPSQAKTPDGHDNGAHSARWAAARARGYTVEAAPGTMNRAQKREQMRWVKKQIRLGNLTLESS